MVELGSVVPLEDSRFEIPGASMELESEVWSEGDLIADEYEVIGILGEGGMGTVYRVRHRTWGIDLAVKCPRADYYDTDDKKVVFVRECHAWMDLGLHPHIVTCHYVRVLGDIPRVFAEYIGGGSLKDWIGDGELYEGDAEETLARILDISIQFAWGLQHAHDRGLIHQDVKPDNVMLTPEGVAKVTDFGLVNAHTTESVNPVTAAGHTVLGESGGYSPEYCSPEQAENCAQVQAGVSRDQLVKLTRRTDIYSWAVSVLEMFCGRVQWMAGNVAGRALDGYLASGPGEDDLPAMPSSVAGLLRKCLALEPDDRPLNFTAVVEELRGIYEQELGKAYPDEPPAPPTELADVLNNKAISFLELDDPERAATLWSEALQRDPHHTEATYNYGVHQWQAAEITDDELVSRMENMRRSNDDDWRDEYLLALVQIARGDRGAATQMLEEAVSNAANEEEIASALRTSQAMPSVHVGSLDALSRQSTCLDLSADGRKAVFGNRDGTVRVWDLGDGCEVHALQAHEAKISSVYITADGSRAVSTSWDDHLTCVWDLASGQCLQRYEQAWIDVGRVHVGPDEGIAVLDGGDKYYQDLSCIDATGTWGLLTGSFNRDCWLFDIIRGRCVRAFTGHRGRVSAVCISADGCIAVSMGEDEQMRFWEVATGKCIGAISIASGYMSSLSISADRRWVVDSSARLWDLTKNQCVRHFPVCSLCMRLSGDGRYVVDADVHLQMWECATGRCVLTLYGGVIVSEFRVSRNGGRILALGEDGTITVYSVAEELLEPGRTEPHHVFSKVVSSSEAQQAAVHFKQVVSNAERALVAGRIPECILLVYDATRLPGYAKHPSALELRSRIREQTKLTGYSHGWLAHSFDATDVVRSLCFSANSRQLLSAGEGEHPLRLWDVSTGECVRKFDAVAEQDEPIAHFACADRYILSFPLYGEEIQVIDAASGRIVRTMKGYEHPGTQAIAVSADGLWVLSGGTDRKFRLWEFSTGRCIRTGFGVRVDASVEDVMLSPCGCFAITVPSGEDHVVRLWGLTTKKLLREMNHYQHCVSAVCATRDEQWIITGAEDGRIRFWDTASGECTRTLEGGPRPVYDLCLSPDEHYMFYLQGGCICVRDVATGAYVQKFHEGGNRALTLSADGRWAATIARGTRICIWELDWELEAAGPVDWDEGARPYLEHFLLVHTPYAGVLPAEGEPSEEEIVRALTREGQPVWTEADFDGLLKTLGHVGFGWLRPAGVRCELDRMAEEWTGPSLLPALV
jgi:WD40 repeat protein/serine/threonine protein kinase